MLWEDVWVNQDSLKNCFPRLYNILDDNENRFIDIGSLGEKTWEWKLCWKRKRFV